MDPQGSAFLCLGQTGRTPGQNTHAKTAILSQQPPILRDGRTDPSAAGNDRGRRKPTPKLSLDPDTILNDDEGIAMVQQRAQKIRSRCNIRKGSIKRSILRKRAGNMIRPARSLERAKDKAILSICSLLS